MAIDTIPRLAGDAYTFDLAAALAATGVTVHGRHPASLTPTTIVREAEFHTIDTLETGLGATLRLVADPALAGVTGRYFDGQRAGRAHAQAYDQAFRAGAAGSYRLPDRGHMLNCRSVASVPAR